MSEQGGREQWKAAPGMYVGSVARERKLIPDTFS